MMLAVKRLAGISRAVHCGAASAAGQQWRLGTGRSRSGTEYGPLTDLPDWSFADGRPAPAGKGQMKRTQTQRAISRRVQQLLTEVEQGKLAPELSEDETQKEVSSS